MPPDLWVVGLSYNRGILIGPHRYLFCLSHTYSLSIRPGQFVQMVGFSNSRPFYWRCDRVFRIARWLPSIYYAPQRHVVTELDRALRSSHADGQPVMGGRCKPPGTASVPIRCGAMPLDNLNQDYVRTALCQAC